MNKILIFFPTYNEAGNVKPLIKSILTYLPEANILVVDDASPDETGKLLDRLAKDIPKINVIHRAGKMGVGSAHKIAMYYALLHEFDCLITMDADFSHHPKYLPTFINLLSTSDFVTGSRYAEGGKCDYGWYRTLISRTANFVAKYALGLKLKENTTLYRGYRLSLLKRLDLNDIKSEGYSFAIESLFKIAKIADYLDEFPIHFENRRDGKSKISKVEIYKAILTILRLWIGRVLLFQKPKTVSSEKNIEKQKIICSNCGGKFHTVIHPARNGKKPVDGTSPYSCSTQPSRSHARILKCLQCDLVFMEQKLDAAKLVDAYANAVDPTYVENIKARERTFAYNLSNIRQYIHPDDKILDVGSYCGAFLKVAKDSGYDNILGLEPSSWAVEVSTKLVDTTVIQGTISDMPKDMKDFDVITLWDVLEHFSDPVSELKKINELLEPTGTFLFSTLMVDNWFPRLVGKYWPWYMDMHLFYFTDNTITDILAKTGFKIIDESKYCHIITFAYLLSKLGTLGVPGMLPLSRHISKYKWGRTVIPFRFGDIKLFVCKKDDL